MKKKVPLEGTEPILLPNSRLIGPADPNQLIRITVSIRRPLHDELVKKVERNALLMPKDREYLTHEEMRSKFGADSEDINKIREFAKDNGLNIESANVSECSITLSGTIASMSKAFNVQLVDYEHNQGNYRGRVGSVYIPTVLVGIVKGIYGLDTRRRVKSHIQVVRDKGFAQATSGRSFFYPAEIAGLYNFPSGLDGSGQTIAIPAFTYQTQYMIKNKIPASVGYNKADLDTYFKSLNLNTPTIVQVSVDGTQNQPSGYDDHNGDLELVTDVEIAGAIAPGAKIVVYYAANSASWKDVMDKVNSDTDNNPNILSISYDEKEIFCTKPISVADSESAFLSAAAKGITIFVADGDHGSSDYNPELEAENPGNSCYRDDGLAHVLYPSSSKWVTACGGTSTTSSNSILPCPIFEKLYDALTGRDPKSPEETLSEKVWNNGDEWATGGGISDLIDLPTWQTNFNIPPSVNPGARVGRGVPDVAGNADGKTGYSIYFNGKKKTVGGTSCVAPLYAGLIARINQKSNDGGFLDVGFLTAILYTKLSGKVFQDITDGNNENHDSKAGYYRAGPSWDACTGLGRIDGTKLLNVLTF